MPSPEEEFKPEVEIICPFCGGRAQLGYNGAVHFEPICQVFQDLEADEYVHQVYEFIQKTKKPEDQPS